MNTPKVFFKFKDEIIYDIIGDLSIDGITTIKKTLSKYFNIGTEDIEVEYKVLELSDYDIGIKGIFNAIDPNDFDIKVKGVRLNLINGSDEHIDSILDGTLEKHLIFI
jgi:hypothetical protein